MRKSKSIYPKGGRAIVYRHADRYEFLVNGTGPYPEFIYKHLRAPLDSEASTLGQLAVQSIMGYRKLTEDEFVEHQRELNQLLPDEEELVEQGNLPNVCVWPEEEATEISAQVNLEMVDTFMIPLDASSEQIGAAILKAFAAVDAQLAQARRAPETSKVTRARGLKKARRVSKPK